MRADTPGEPANEADVLEGRTDIVSDVSDEDAAAEPQPGPEPGVPVEADSADIQEQQLPVPDDYQDHDQDRTGLE